MAATDAIAAEAEAAVDVARAVTTDVLQLWVLARALMEQNLVQQAAQCLEVAHLRFALPCYCLATIADDNRPA